MQDNQEQNNSEPAYKKYNILRSIDIKGISLNFKDPPLTGYIYRYRCRKNNWNYFVKIDKENIDKLLQNEENKKYIEVNEHKNQTIK